jgi:hypothetical protein
LSLGLTSKRSRKVWRGMLGTRAPAGTTMSPFASADELFGLFSVMALA